jgi:hypothetical protein
MFSLLKNPVHKLAKMIEFGFLHGLRRVNLHHSAIIANSSAMIDRFKGYIAAIERDSSHHKSG